VYATGLFKSAIKATSIASLMLTTEAMIAEYLEEKGEARGGMGGMGMGM
jgi:hypothetical protein